MNVAHVVITPDYARQLLEQNTNNRPCSESHVNFLAREIILNRWKLNGSTIVLNGERLIDGQHRLHAIIKANKPIETLIVEGLSSDVFDTIDAGKKRSSSDVLAIRGEKNTHNLAAAIAIVNSYEKGRITPYNMTSSYRYSAVETEELLEEYQGIRDSVNFICGKQKLRKIMPPSLGSALHYLFSRIEPDLADIFMSRLITGEQLTSDHPVMVLRERLIENTISRAKYPKPYIMAITIKTWNALRQNRPLRQLIWRVEGPTAEDFPTII